MKRYLVELILVVGDDGSTQVERSTMTPYSPYPAETQAPVGPPVKISRIRLMRSEGVREAVTREVPDFPSADAVLKSWAVSAPADGFHRVDFNLKFDDGNTFGGEYQLSNSDTKNPDILARHVRAFVRQQTAIEGEDRDKFKHFWGTYDIGQGGTV